MAQIKLFKQVSGVLAEHNSASDDITAASFTGNGAGLTGLPSSAATQLIFKLEGNVYTTTLPPTVTNDFLVGKDITEARVTLLGLPAGQDFKVQITRNGTATTNSIFTSDATLDVTTGQSATNGVYQVGCTSSATTVGTTTTRIDTAQDTIAADDVIYVIITQVGTGPTGADFICTLTVA